MRLTPLCWSSFWTCDVRLDRVAIRINAFERVVELFDDRDIVVLEAFKQFGERGAVWDLEAEVVEGAWIGRVVAFHKDKVEAFVVLDEQDVAGPLGAGVEAEVRLVEAARLADVSDKKGEMAQAHAQRSLRGEREILIWNGAGGEPVAQLVGGDWAR